MSGPGTRDALLEQLFPFLLEVDSGLRVLSTGVSLQKVCPAAHAGALFGDLFLVRRPAAVMAYDQLRQLEGAVVVLEYRARVVRLRGQVVATPQATLLFLVSPLVSNLDELGELGLTLGDFPPHAATPDFLLLQQSANTALTDARSLAEDLERQQAHLVRANQLLGAQYAVTAVLAGCRSLAEAGSEVLRVVAESLDWHVGVLWDLSESGTTAVCASVWTDGSQAHEPFLRDSQARSFPRGEGLPGRVVATGAPAWITDVTVDDNFPRSGVAAASGLRTGFAFPVAIPAGPDPAYTGTSDRRRERVAFVLEYFSRDLRPFDQRLLATVREIGAKIGQFAQQLRATEALSEAKAQLTSMLSASPTIIYRCRVGETFRVLYVSDNITTVFGWAPQQFLDDPEFFMTLVHPDDHATLRQAYEQVQQSGAAGYDYRLRSRDGTFHWRHDGLRASAWQDGRVIEAVGASQDVSDLKRVEQELRESERRKSAILSSALDCVITADANGCIIDFNAVAEQTFGYTRSEVIGREMAELIVPERLQEAHKSGLARVAASGVGKLLGQRLELPAVKADGQEFPVELAIAVVQQEGPPIFVGYLRDLTEQKRAVLERQRVNEALAESERRYRSVVDTVKEVIFQTDPEGRWTFLNPAWAELTGHAVEDSIGASCGLWVHDDDRVRQREAFQALIAGESAECRLELRYRTAEHHVRWFDVFARLALDGEGTPVGVSGTLNDVTERRRAEEALRDSEARTRAIVDTAAEGVITIDERGTIELFNTAAGAIFGHHPDDVIGLNVSLLMPVNDAEAHDGHLESHLRGRPPRIIGVGRTVEGRRADGTTFPMHLAISEVQVSGRRMFTGIVRDLTDQTRAEQALKQATQNAEAANQAKSEFLAAMSHEIRTPLNAIIGMTDLVLHTDLSGDQRELLKTVLASSDSLLGLINDLLDFSKIEAGQFELDLAAFDPRAMFDVLLRQFAATARTKRLRLLSTIDPALPPFVVGDVGRVRQVMTNLLGNALKFTERGHVALTVETGPGVNATTVTLRVTVADTGIGIPLEKQGRIFEKFFQVDSTIARRFGGTGLGLSISRSLVLQMGGQIWFDTVEGAGTAFHVEIPFELADQGPTAARGLVEHGSSASSGAVPACILVVEDNPDNQRLAEAVLVAAGYRVEIAGDGRQGVARARDYHFDLILMDLQMPEMDGFEATRLIRAAEAERAHTSVPIVALTAHAIQGLRARCLGAGMDEYLTKPFDRRVLLDTLERLIDARPVVLVADDSADMRLLLSRYLEDTGQYRVLTASDGEELLERCRSTRVSLVTIDMQMPPDGGLAAARALRALPDRAAIPLVAVTGLDHREARLAAIDAGFVDYLMKPVSREAFLEAITAALDSGPPAATDGAATPATAPVDGGRRAADSPSNPWGAIRVVIDPLLLDLLPAYLDSRRSDVDRLRALVTSADFEEVRALGHKLKGSGGGYGLDEITRLGRELEVAGDSGAVEAISRAIDALEDYLGRVEVVTE